MDLPSPEAEQLLISSSELTSFRLDELGIAKSSFVGLEISAQYAVARLDFPNEEPLPKPAACYAAFRRLARRISSDCLQLGLAVPVVLTIKLPAEADGTVATAWRQADFDTELNAGEFQMLIVVDGAEASVLSDSFIPTGLLTPIIPGSSDAYRQALRLSSGVDAISEQLFGKIIEPSWNSPEKITEQLIELAESYFPDDESSTNTTPSLPTV